MIDQGPSGLQHLGGCKILHYGLIMADPPWRFKTYSDKGHGKSPQRHYDCMSLEDIKRLPVGPCAAPDCVLWLWATNPMLPQAFEVMDAWGFQFKTAGHWSKRSRGGKLAFGTGYILRNAGEPFLIGTVGMPKVGRNVRSVIEGPRREHSRKPDEAYEAAERLVPGGPFLEVFSRVDREGWDVWGDETGKFNAEGAE